jgi:hypothetical protein
MKKCKKCNELKDESEFYPTGKGYISGTCKKCKIARQKELVKGKDLTQYYKDYAPIANKARRVKRLSDSISAQKDRERCKAWREQNKEYMRDYQAKWRKENKVNNNLRKRFKRWFKSSSPKLQTLVGCTQDDFKQHLSNQFSPEMNWRNYGSLWSIDHIFPVSKAKTEEEGIAIFHYLNCRPMLITENSAKGNRINESEVLTLLSQPVPELLKRLIENELSS